jgi:hypothetical protein
MTTDTVLQAEPVLADLADQFAHWRQTRQHHEPIPPRLWSQAVALTALLPYGQVAKRLRLSPTDLKKRCLARPGMDPAEAAPAAPTFVEVTGVAVDALPASPSLLIEVERPDGARLRVHATASLPLAPVLRAFLDSPGCCN